MVLCVELPVVGPPATRDMRIDESVADIVKLVGWANGAALCLAKAPGPISPTRPLNPHAQWMQGPGYLVVRDAARRFVGVECIDNALEVLAAYNALKAEAQHACLFPGSNGHLVDRAEHALMAAAARTKFSPTLGRDGDREA